MENARVEIRSGDTLLYTLFTDRNGRTERVSLSAPAASLSLRPGIPNAFALYSVAVTAEGFHPFFFSNVPVFSGITSIQPAELIPENAFLPNESRPEVGIDVAETEV